MKARFFVPTAVIIILCLCLSVRLGYGATIRVPFDQPTIQAGIDAAVNGDIVVVSDGTYTGVGNVNLDFLGKAITVKSENGAVATIIDCQNTANTRGFIFQTGETTASILDGFTIQNGSTQGTSESDGGGAIHCSLSSPTILNCILTHNTVEGLGGGLYCKGSPAPVITNCLITNNTANTGGGILANNSAPTITNCTITGNTAAAGGGIFLLANSPVTIVNTILWGDTATFAGNEIFFLVIFETKTTPITITFSDVQGGQQAFDLGPNPDKVGDPIYENNIESDPRFVDAVGGDYDLDDFSPCIGKGTAIDAPMTDIEGNLRGTPPDIGAFENPRDVSLPVELSAFTGTVVQNGVQLIWRTESETNNLGFHVYRSRRKEGEYVRITPTLISGQGSDSTPHDYSFLDETAEEGNTYWYRIVDVDFSGVTDKSDPIQVVFRRQEAGKKVLPTYFALYQNYPNPFNPETWIPYNLADDAKVELRIYNTAGLMVRMLRLGTQPAGSYLTQDKAAYWDGRGETGELVSSGIYYYHLTTSTFSATRKMLIRK